MKFKRMIKTILVFIPVMILICLLFGLVFYLMDPIRFDYSENQIGNYLLYLLGYGSLAKHEIVVQNLLAVIGIISLSIFTANLTVNLFWKNGNIRISTELLTWKEKQNQLTASLLIGNSGENIYRLSFSLVLYDENGQMFGRLEKECVCPLLVKKGIWVINLPVTKGRGFLFDSLSRMKVHHKRDRLFAVLEYVDGATCQENVIVREILEKNIEFSGDKNGFLLDTMPHALMSRDNITKNHQKQVWRQLKHADRSVLAPQSILIEWLKCGIVPFRLSLSQPINAEAVHLSHRYLPFSERDALTMEINFSKRTAEEEPIPFVMACLTLHPPQDDWREFYAKDAWISLYVSGTPTIEYMYLEVKDSLMRELLKHRIPVTDIIVQHRFRLQESNMPSEFFEHVLQVCITVFSIDTNQDFGTLHVDGCELFLPTP